MLASYPSAWLLLTLPFVSIYLVRATPRLLALAMRRNATMRVTGLVGLCVLLLALIGVVPPLFGLPIALLGGLVSGFTVFTLPRDGGTDGDDWRRWKPPPDDPPPPDTEGRFDWDQFDRVRAQWQRQAVLRRLSAAQQAGSDRSLS